MEHLCLFNNFVFYSCNEIEIEAEKIIFSDVKACGKECYNYHDITVIK